MAPPLSTGTQLERFVGVAPLFPLPTVALLPQVLQPLHVFEERYRRLTEHALQGPRLIAMAVLQPGWETRYEHNDLPLHPVACLSQVDVDRRLPDGRYLLLVRGLIRARIAADLPPTQPFRQARLELLPDVYSSQPVIDRTRRRRELLEAFLKLHPQCDETAEFPLLPEGELSLGALCDVLAFSAGLETPDLIGLLNETRVDLRSDLLLDHLRRQMRTPPESGAPGFPPLFSRN